MILKDWAFSHLGTKGSVSPPLSVKGDRFTTVGAEKGFRVHTLTFILLHHRWNESYGTKVPRKREVFLICSAGYSWYSHTPGNYPVVPFEGGASWQLRVFRFESWYLLQTHLTLNLNAKVARQVRSFEEPWDNTMYSFILLFQ